MKNQKGTPLTLLEAIEHTYATRWQRQKDGERSRQRALVLAGPVLSTAAEALTPGQVLDLVARRREEVAAATVNRETSALSAALKAAYDDGLLESPGPRMPTLREGPGRERVPTRDEVAAMLRALRAVSRESRQAVLARRGHGQGHAWEDEEPGIPWLYYARAARLLYRTGMRRGEALSFRPGDITLQPGLCQGLTIRLQDTKAGTPREVPVPAACSAWLRRVTEKFLHVGADLPCIGLRESTFSAAWRAARAKAGIGDWFVPHSLRHARATELVRAGTPVPIVARILGHRDWKTTMRYTHPTLDDLQEAIERR